MIVYVLLSFAFILLGLVAWTELRAKPAPLSVRRSLLVALIIVLTILAQHLSSPVSSRAAAIALVAPAKIGTEAGHAFTVPENLFRKITDEERADWQTRFAGVRT